MKDFQSGITAPPLHVDYRSTTMPYFEDDFGSGRREKGTVKADKKEVVLRPNDQERMVAKVLSRSMGKSQVCTTNTIPARNKGT